MAVWIHLGRHVGDIGGLQQCITLVRPEVFVATFDHSAYGVHLLVSQSLNIINSLLHNDLGRDLGWVTHKSSPFERAFSIMYAPPRWGGFCIMTIDFRKPTLYFNALCPVQQVSRWALCFILWDGCGFTKYAFVFATAAFRFAVFDVSGAI